MFTIWLALDALEGLEVTNNIVDGTSRLAGIGLGDKCPTDRLSVYEDADKTICRNGRDSIVIEGAALTDVANRLLAEESRLDAFAMGLVAGQASASLEGIVNAGAKMLGAATLVVDEKSMMCAMSAPLDDGVTRPSIAEPDAGELKYARLNGRLPWNALEFKDHDMVFASQLLSSQGRPFSGKVFDSRTEAIACHIESGDREFSAFLFVFVPEDEVTRGKLQIVEMIAGAVRTWIDSHEGGERLFSKVDLLTRLAGGDDVTDAEIDEGLRQMGGCREFVLARVLHSSETSHAWAASKIQEGMEGSRCFEFRDVLFALCPADVDVVPVLESLAAEYDIRFGLSWKFADLRMVSEAVGQTDIALFYTADKVAVLDSHCMMFYIFTQITSSTGGVEIMHPALETLYAHDSSHTTEYARTLWVYLRHERNLVGASEDLGIHRNSLIYRIKRIEEMIPDVDLDDPEVREHLMMSYRIRGLRDRSDEGVAGE